MFRFNSGSTGTSRGAEIIAAADANWTAGSSYPTRLIISTTASGATSSTERLRITSAGICSITTPGNTADGTYYSTVTINNTGSSTWSRLRFDRSGVAKWGLSLGTDDTFRISNLYTDGSSASPDDDCFVIANSSKVGIGSDVPTEKLDVAGNATVTGTVAAADFNSTSDIRLKTNIQPIEDPLAKVIQIEGVSFNWKKDNKPALGVIADQVEEILPELVQNADPKTVNYNGLIGLLIEAVKEQQTQIDSLKERISKLE